SDDHGVEIDDNVWAILVARLPLAHDARARLGVVGDSRRANRDARVTKEDAVAVRRVAETPRAPRVAALAKHPHARPPVRAIDGDKARRRRATVGRDAPLSVRDDGPVGIREPCPELRRSEEHTSELQSRENL